MMPKAKGAGHRDAHRTVVAAEDGREVVRATFYCIPSPSPNSVAIGSSRIPSSAAARYSSNTGRRA